MATLQTTNGVEIRFDAQRVTEVASDAGGSGTTISGITEGTVHIAGAPVDFLNRLGIRAQFAELTRPDNSSVWIRGTAVAWIRAPLRQEYPPDVQAVVNLGEGAQGVTQLVQETADRLNRAGANL
jgi:hypothetical protein